MSATSTSTAASTSTSSLQTYVDQLGAYAKTPYPAYGLASAFALSAPFSFAGGRDQARLPNKLPGQAALENVAGKAVASAVKSPRALPPFWQLAGFAATIGGGGYIIEQGDILNGAGTVTAWSSIYLFFYGIQSLRRPALFPVLLTTSALVLGAGVHGSYYFSRTSWKGAIPGLQAPPNKDYGFRSGAKSTS